MFVLALAAMAAPSCVSTGLRSGDAPESLQALGPDGKPRLTQAEVGALVRSFADKYVAVVNQAITEMMEKTSDPAARAVAQRRRLASASSAYSIAATPNPEIALLDLAVLVTVEREIIVRGDMHDAFGDLVNILTNAYDKVDSDVWGLVSRVFTPQQSEELTDAIERWLTANADLKDASFIRVEEFAKLRSESTLSRVGQPGGLSMLAPINDATRAADDIRQLGERALFLTQRLPQVIRWQAELLVGDALGDPRSLAALGNVKGVGDGVSRLASTLDDLPAEVQRERAETIRAVREAVAAERDAALAALDDRTKTLGALLADARGALADADGLSARLAAAAESARLSLDAVERLAARFVAEESAAADRGAPTARAYLASIDTLAVAADRLSDSLAASERLLASNDLARQTQTINAAAEARIGQLTRSAVIVIASFFACLAAYRLITARARRSGPAAGA